MERFGEIWIIVSTTKIIIMFGRTDNYFNNAHYIFYKVSKNLNLLFQHTISHTCHHIYFLNKIITETEHYIHSTGYKLSITSDPPAANYIDKNACIEKFFMTWCINIKYSLWVECENLENVYIVVDKLWIGYM